MESVKKKPPQQESNLLDMVPVHTCKWETGEDGRVYLLVPRFTNRFFKWTAEQLKKTEFVKVHLDERGSPAWSLINGSRTILEIGKGIEKDEDETDQHMYERLAEFFVILKKNKFIDLR